VRRFHPKLWRQKVIFYPKQHDCRPPLTLLFHVSLVEEKFKFDPIEMIETELQSVLNTLTERDFEDAFQKVAEALGTVHTHGKGLLRG
jgi:hypothetical protein